MTDPISDPEDTWNLPPKRGWTPGERPGPLSQASCAAGALLRWGEFQVCAFPQRLAQAPGQRKWRLGKDADGLWAQRVGSADSVGPGGNEVPPGRGTGGLSTWKPGYSVMACQGADVLFGSREGDGPISDRSEGTCARSRAGPKSELVRRVKVGYCP